MSTHAVVVGSALPLSLSAAFRLRDVRVRLQFESYGNENWLVEDASRARYVLRRQWLNADPRRIELQFALQQHLRQSGLPVARQIETADGESFALDDGGGVWLLLEYIEGAEYDFSRIEQTAEAGRCLARLHLAAASFAGDGPSPEYKPPITACWSRVRENLAELAQLVPGEDGRAALADLGSWWDELLGEWPPARFERLPSGWLHGDYHGRNLVFEGDSIIGLFDFDDADRGPYAHDIAGGMVKFGREGRGLVIPRPTFARAFLDGYESVRPLAAEEQAAVQAFAWVGYPPNPHSYRYWRDKGGEDAKVRFLQDMANMRALRSQLS